MATMVLWRKPYPTRPPQMAVAQTLIGALTAGIAALHAGWRSSFGPARRDNRQLSGHRYVPLATGWRRAVAERELERWRPSPPVRS